MKLLSVVLVFCATVCFALAALDVKPPRGINLVALGLLCWLVSTLVIGKQ